MAARSTPIIAGATLFQMTVAEGHSLSVFPVAYNGKTFNSRDIYGGNVSAARPAGDD